MTKTQQLAEALGTALRPAPTGIGVMEIEDGSGQHEVSAYFSSRPDETGLALLAAAFDARPFAISAIGEHDWISEVRRELTPVRAGRFVVHGGHDAGNLPHAYIALRIEAAMAFGTGHHGSTAGCLQAISQLSRGGFRPHRIADIGCGSGVLAMAAARIWRPARIIASDIDPVAAATARANLAVNALRGPISVVRARGFRDTRLWRGLPFDLIMANILAGPLKAMAADFAARTAPGSRVVLSGILTRQAKGVAARFRAHGFRARAHIRLSPWTTLILERQHERTA